MNTPHPAAAAAGGVAIALGLAALVGLAPEATPRLVATPVEVHDHKPYHPPINQPYTTAVDLCLDREGKAEITGVTSPTGAPAVKRIGEATGGNPVITAVCPGAHGGGGESHAANGQRVPIVLEGFSPKGARNTIVRVTYTLEGVAGTQQADIVLPAMTQRLV